MKNKTCRTIFLIAFCLLFVLHANGIVVAVFAQPKNVNKQGGKDPAVDNKTVSPGREGRRPKIGDNELKKRIEGDLKEKKIKGAKVSVSQGIVTLTGEVGNESQKTEAEQSAERFTGEKPENYLTAPSGSNTGSNISGSGQQDGSGSKGDNTNAGTQPSGNKNASAESEEGSSLWTAIKWTLAIIGLLFAVGLLGYAILLYVRSRRAMMDDYFKDVRNRQDGLATKLDTSITALKKEFNERITGLKDEIKILSTNLKDDRREILDGVRRLSGAAAPVYPGYPNQMAAQKENVHTFPISADDYLSKVKKGATVVKPDFQNGILVQDSDGVGELMLVQDSDAAPGGLFYVVPKVGYFQTKQDFHNYYEKYYDCARPTSGEVWIVEPAVVDKVSGGWELRDKGELEIK